MGVHEPVAQEARSSLGQDLARPLGLERQPRSSGTVLLQDDRQTGTGECRDEAGGILLQHQFARAGLARRRQPERLEGLAAVGEIEAQPGAGPAAACVEPPGQGEPPGLRRTVEDEASFAARRPGQAKARIEPRQPVADAPEHRPRRLGDEGTGQGRERLEARRPDAARDLAALREQRARASDVDAAESVDRQAAEAPDRALPAQIETGRARRRVAEAGLRQVEVEREITRADQPGEARPRWQRIEVEPVQHRLRGEPLRRDVAREVEPQPGGARHHEPLQADAPAIPGTDRLGVDLAERRDEVGQRRVEPGPGEDERDPPRIIGLEVEPPGHAVEIGRSARPQQGARDADRSGRLRQAIAVQPAAQAEGGEILTPPDQLVEVERQVETSRQRLQHALEAGPCGQRLRQGVRIQPPCPQGERARPCRREELPLAFQPRRTTGDVDGQACDIELASAARDPAGQRQGAPRRQREGPVETRSRPGRRQDEAAVEGQLDVLPRHEGLGPQPAFGLHRAGGDAHGRAGRLPLDPPGARQRHRRDVRGDRPDAQGLAARIAPDQHRTADGEAIETGLCRQARTGAGRQAQRAALVERHDHRRALGPRIRDAELAAHQRRQGEFDGQRLDRRAARLRVVVPETDILERQPRRGQQLQADGAADPGLDAERARQPLLEMRPVATPVDEARPHQRGEQSQHQQAGQNCQGLTQRPALSSSWGEAQRSCRQGSCRQVAARSRQFD